MFDDPKKELQRLQKELLEEEEGQWDDLRDIQDILEEYEEEDSVEAIIREFGAESRREPAYQNYANGYGRRRDAFEETPGLEDDAVLYREDARGKRKKEKGLGGLVFLAVLETLGILAIAAWWAVMLL